MSDDQVLHEVSTFIQLDVVYYRHESGVVFTTARENLPRPHTFKLSTELPLDAEPFEPTEGCRECEDLDLWTDTCDVTLARLVDRRDGQAAMTFP